MTTKRLTPYDTGKRAEPKLWYRGDWTEEDFAEMSPIERQLEEDRFGKVDFDDDESATIATVWIEKNEAGEYVLHVAQLAGKVMVKVHG